MVKTISIFLLTAIFQLHAFAQKCKSDAKTIDSKQKFIESISNNTKKAFEQLQKTIPGILIDMPYATTANFTKIVLYNHPIAYMRVEPALALKKVQENLEKVGLGLKIFDAFRPFSVTCTMWHLTPNKHFVANPRKGSNHNRGLAVDLTLIDFKTKKELDMGTGFDNFTDSASFTFTNLPLKTIANRKILKDAMKRVGFTSLPKEWWHYNWRNDYDYEIIDLDFIDIASLIGD